MATSSKSHSQVAQLYHSVIEDVINNVRESFLDDGVDEQVLQELKQIWESKLGQTKAVDSPTIGDRAKPQVYTYLTQAKSGQPMIYQALPTQSAQLSSASQHARMVATDALHQQRSAIVLPTQQRQIFGSYQPVTVFQKPGLQMPQQGRQMTSGHAMVLTSTPQLQQKDSKSGSSAIIQVDGCRDAPQSHSLIYVKTGQCEFGIRKKKSLPQVDGGGDSSSSDEGVEDDDDEDDDDDDDDDDEDDETARGSEEKVEEEPLNSDDDDSDQDPNELFDTENVVVCQYDKIHRAKAKWKFNLKYGIMNLQGKDHVFQKASGEADW